METETQRIYQERILRVLMFIQEHLDEDLSLGELARLAHFSPFHFHRVFRGMVGEPLHEHIRRLRLERAALRLRSGHESILNLALDAGYDTHEAFTRAFTAMFGQSPSRFREVHRPIAWSGGPGRVHLAAEGEQPEFIPADTGGASMDVRIEKVPTMQVAFVRNTGPYATVGAAWEKLCAWAGPRRLLGPRTQFLGVCHDDPEITPPDKIRYDACLTLNVPLEPAGEIGVQEVGGGEYAIAEHRGPYENLAQTYGRLCGEWIPSHGREPRSAPSLEIYHNDPKKTPPQDLRTEIFVPLEPLREQR